MSITKLQKSENNMEKKKLGRPLTGRTKITSSFCLLKENIAFIEAVAQKNNCSKSAALDFIINDFIVLNVQREAE